MGKIKNRNVLVISDLHEPFCIDGAIEFTKKIYKKYKCNEVVFIGDVIDNHFSSYHETDPDGMSAGDELIFAVNAISKWYNAFPKAKVVIGNHDRMVERKSHTGGIPKTWIKSYQEVLNVPNWEFNTEFIIDDVRYIHGEGQKARTRIRRDMISTVQGHYHTEMAVDWAVGQNFKVFGMQVGCLIDKNSYAMAYAKNFPKPAIGLGVVLNNGTLPIIIPADLKNNKII